MKNSKIPLLPLYIADAVVIVLVLTIALPSAFRGESISTAQTIFCCLAVLLSMFALLVPYFLEYKKDIATKFEHSDEAQKNFEIIFDDLSALREALADIVERLEKNEDNFSAFLYKFQITMSGIVTPYITQLRLHPITVRQAISDSLLHQIIQFI